MEICRKSSNNNVRSLAVSVAGTATAIGGLLMSSNSIIGMSICASAALFVSFKDDIFQFNAKSFKLDSAIQNIISDQKYLGKLVTSFSNLISSIKGAIGYIRSVNIDHVVKNKIYRLIGLDGVLVKNLMYEDVNTSVANIKEIVSLLDDSTVRLLIENSLAYRRREIELERRKKEEDLRLEENVKGLHQDLNEKIREISING